ncbi:MAG: TRAP transporter TatT component family protein [Candidatus Neomarinimicrobiota bacterium]
MNFHYIVIIPDLISLFRVSLSKLTLILSIIFLFQSCSPALMLEISPGTAEHLFEHKLQKQSKKVRLNPHNPQILEAASMDLVKYGYGFLLESADQVIFQDYEKSNDLYEQALENFAKAIEYGESALSIKYSNYQKWNRLGKFETPPFSAEDVSLIFWTAGAYAGAITASKADPDWLIHFPRIGRLFDQALILDPGWNKGALYSAMISYTMLEPNPAENREEISRDYFQKAVFASNGKDCGPYLALAEKVSKTNQDKSEFISLLNQALDIDNKVDRDLKLSNAISKKRARWLLDNVDEFFY